MKSEKVDLLASALAKAQSEMPVVPMNAFNPFLKNKYADLAEMVKVAVPVLSKNGLTISQLPASQGDRVGVTTVLMHSSGQWIEDTVTLPIGDEKGKSTAQVAGSVITYLRRYAYGAVVGLVTDEDADGNQPVEKQHEKPERVYKTEQASSNEHMYKIAQTGMSLEMAMGEVASDGKKYGDCTTTELNGKRIGLMNLKKKTPEKWTDEHQRKFDAVLKILEARAADHTESDDNPDQAMIELGYKA